MSICHASRYIRAMKEEMFDTKILDEYTGI